MPIQAGELRHTVTIVQQQTTGAGPRGEDLTTLVTLGTVPAKIEPLAGRKLELARQVVATATHEVTIRYLPGLTPDQTQIQFGSRTFNIGAVRDVMETQFAMILTATERQ